MGCSHTLRDSLSGACLSPFHCTAPRPSPRSNCTSLWRA
jgi:hypothetical protein